MWRAPFDDFVNSFTLKFRDPLLEERYVAFKRQWAEGFDKSKIVILIVAAVMTTSSSVMAYIHYSHGEVHAFWYLFVTAGIGNLSILLEYLIHCWPRLAFFRSFVLTTGCYFAAVFYSAEFLPVLGLLPG